MPEQALCWNCGAEVVAIIDPLSRTEQCKQCGKDLHVCRMCLFFSPGKVNHSQEPVAEKVKDTQRANFCGYFKLNFNAYDVATKDQQARAQQQLHSLFGMEDQSGDQTPTEPGDLFKS